MVNEDGVSLWQDEAKCSGIDSEEFFDRATEKQAKRFCATCPVRGDCLEYALVYDTYGIWGGLSFRERKRKYPTWYREALREDLAETGQYNSELKL
jgi:WhiB family redox-sensing transcriptional regulator